MRAVTRDSTKVSAEQAQHIMRNNVLQNMLEAVGTDFMPAMTSKRGNTQPTQQTMHFVVNPHSYSHAQRMLWLVQLNYVLHAKISCQ